MSELALPKEWIEVTVDDVFDQISTTNKKIKTKDSKVKGSYPVVDQGKELINGYHDNKDNLISVDKPVIIFGDHTRCLKWVTFSFVPGADGVKVLKSKSYVSEKFSLYQLQSIQIEDRGYGRHFKLLKESKFYVIPELEQTQIVELLDSSLTTISQTQARLDAIPKLIEKFRQSVLNDAVTGRLTEEWRTKKRIKISDWKNIVLSDVIEKTMYGTSKKSSKEGNVPVLRMGNLQSGKIDWNNLVYTSDSVEIDKFDLKSGDLLFNRTNSSELVGKTSIYRGSREAIFAGYLIRLRPLDTADSEFLNYHLNSVLAKNYCYKVKSDGVSQSNINAKKISAYPLELPSIEEQKEIVKQINQLLSHADQIGKSVAIAKARVDSLTQSILHQAFTGNLTAEWREQNPELISGENSAEALLAKIKAEKQGSSKKKPSKG